MIEIKTNKIKKPGAFLKKTVQQVRDTALEIASKAKGRILDVGCGNCLFLLKLEKKYRSQEQNMFGVDLNFDLLQEARELAKDNNLHLPNLIKGDGTSLPFKTGSFDYTFCLNTFINLDLPIIEQILKELGRVTVSGGYIIVDIRNKNNPLLTLKYFLNNLTSSLKTNAYSPEEFHNCFKKNNLKVVKIINVRILPFITFDKIIILRKEE